MKLTQVFHITAAAGWLSVGLDGIVNKNLARSVPMIFFMSAYALVGFHIISFNQHKQNRQLLELLVKYTTLEKTDDCPDEGKE